ncbi:ATP-binding protein [Pedobacter aquatilis]|uniref:ATP-binding protein n=1 Tax=Pedobacter aquatilis TaxID=351343 RepID=UPI00293114DB|nr:ATP-binding protein [Pedobacter aquatilis]
MIVKFDKFAFSRNFISFLMLRFVSAMGSEALLEILMQSKDATAIYTGEDLRIQLVNDAMLRIWGKDLSVHGQTFEQALPELKGHPFAELLKQVWLTGDTYTARSSPATLNVHGIPKTSYFDFEYRAIHDEHGKVQCILHTATDVSDRMAAWAMVKQKEDQELQHRLDLSRANEFLANSVQELQAMNEEFQATNEDLASLNEEYQATNEELQASLEEVAKLNWEANSKNEQLRIANDRLASSEKNLSTALKAANLGSFELDIRSGLMKCSEQYEVNYGRELGQDFSKDILFESILPEHHENIRTQLNQAINNNVPYQVEYQILRPDGSIHWIQSTGRVQYDHTGIAAKLIGVTQLITDRKNYEIRKDEFLTVASHELKTPITVLKANLQLLARLRSDIQPPTAIRYIDSALGAMAKVGSIVDDLLDMGRYSKGDISLNKVTFNIEEIIRGCYEHLDVGESAKVITDTLPLFIYADIHRIEQVLVNFVNNAFKYAPESEKITIQARQLGNSVRVAVSDLGKGIPAAEIPMLFNRYWQSPSGKSHGQGLGLGLYICAEIIRKHGGQIGADSSPGEGTTFWFVLPLSPEKDVLDKS